MTKNDQKWHKKSKVLRTDGPTDRRSQLKSRVHATKNWKRFFSGLFFLLFFWERERERDGVYEEEEEEKKARENLQLGLEEI